MKNMDGKSSGSQSNIDSVPTQTSANKRKCKTRNTNAGISKISIIHQASATQMSTEAKNPCGPLNGKASVNIKNIEENEILKIPRGACKTLDEMLVLADSYPNFFHFEKGPRSIHYTLVFYGERYNSTSFTRFYTYWHCYHRQKYKCKATICATNDYKYFERKHTHTHGNLPEKTGTVLTPREALPEIFEVCRKLIKQVSRTIFWKNKLTAK